MVMNFFPLTFKIYVIRCLGGVERKWIFCNSKGFKWKLFQVFSCGRFPTFHSLFDTYICNLYIVSTIFPLKFWYFGLWKFEWNHHEHNSCINSSFEVSCFSKFLNIFFLVSLKSWAKIHTHYSFPLLLEKFLPLSFV